MTPKVYRSITTVFLTVLHMFDFHDVHSLPLRPLELRCRSVPWLRFLRPVQKLRPIKDRISAEENQQSPSLLECSPENVAHLLTIDLAAAEA